MDKPEFIKEAKNLGYTDKEIAEDIELYEDTLKDGVKFDWEQFLVKKPIED